jgi:hypothetical protein
LLQIISKASDFEALQNLGSGTDTAPSPRTSLDSQQAEAASLAAASALSAAASASATLPSGAGASPNDLPPFEATEEWLAALRDSLPLEPSMRVLHHLQVPPPMASPLFRTTSFIVFGSLMFFASATTVVCVTRHPLYLFSRAPLWCQLVLKFVLRSVIIPQVGLLPVPHPILVRKYHSNTNTQVIFRFSVIIVRLTLSLSHQVWLTTYIWGIIYLRNQDPLVFDSACVRLFKISFTD